MTLPLSDLRRWFEAAKAELKRLEGLRAAQSWRVGLLDDQLRRARANLAQRRRELEEAEREVRP